MLDKDIIFGIGAKDFEQYAKAYFVNMENNMRTLHKTNFKSCYYSKYALKFIAFESIEEVEEYEAQHSDATPFRRCGNCFRKR